MTLPDLLLQGVYARLAWGVVLAAVLVCGVLRAYPFSPVRLALVIAAALGLMWLPGEASPAHWLGLAFQRPSGLLAGLCVAALVRSARPARADPTPVLVPALAAVLAVGGAVLYADAAGWLSAGIYGAGFGPLGAPLAGIGVGLLATGLIARGVHRETAAVLLASAALFALLRLPSGNFFDAMLDPFLWCWAMWCLLSRASRRARLWHRQRLVQP